MPEIPKDCTGWEFKSRPEYEFPPGLVLDRHCFSQETPDADIFPDGMTGVTFLNCNLDNCYIPEGNTVVGGSQRRFAPQNDLRDWEIDYDDNPTTLINEESWTARGYSTDPQQIPADLAIDPVVMRLDVISGEKTVEDLLGAEVVAQLTASRDATLTMRAAKAAAAKVSG
jgi:hypothetical protein